MTQTRGYLIEQARRRLAKKRDILSRNFKRERAAKINERKSKVVKRSRAKHAEARRAYGRRRYAQNSMCDIEKCKRYHFKHRDDRIFQMRLRRLLMRVVRAEESRGRFE